jgi:hypothetical protein
MKPDRNPAGPRPGATARRAEKLSALSNLLGPEIMERLRQRDKGFETTGTTEQEASTDRVAWQRSRLLERIRTGLADDAGPGEAAVATDAPSLAARHLNASVDTRIAAAMELATLADEHPAVIARVLDGMDRDARVAVLRTLPGPTARAAIHRLRAR